MATNSNQKTALRRKIFSFVTPMDPVRLSYTAQKRQLSRAMQQHNCFQQGTILETLEKGDENLYCVIENEVGVPVIMMYPVVHYVEVESNQQLNKHPALLSATAMGSSYNVQQGVYTEIKQFRPYPEKPFPAKNNESRAFIIIGFKTLDKTFNEVLEEMWKDWTGARSIYLNLPDELGLMELSFYRRLCPQDLNLFMYLLLVQCENVTKTNRWMLLDYVQRLRIEKMMGYVSVYRTEASFGNTNGFDQLELDDLVPQVDI